MGTAWWDDHKKGIERDAAEQDASTACYQKLQESIEAFTDSAQSSARSLEDKYHWKSGEAGFEEPTDQQQATAQLKNSSNYAGLVNVYINELRRKPRDPFTIYNLGYYQSLLPGNSAKDLLDDAHQYLLAVSLVPSGSQYDEYRSQGLLGAAYCTDRASASEVGSHPGFTATNPAAGFEVRLLDACLKYTADIDGTIQGERAWALAKSGEPAEALKQANSEATLQSNNSNFAYNFSCLLSDVGNTKLAFDWFSHAVKDLGWNKMALARTDPDLKAMRDAYKDEFETLITPQFAYSVNWGNIFIGDSIILQNNSPFLLTNVRINIHLSCLDSQEKPVDFYPGEYTTLSIQAKGSVRCDNVSHAHGHRYYDGTYIKIESDQNPSPQYISVVTPPIN